MPPKSRPLRAASHEVALEKERQTNRRLRAEIDALKSGPVDPRARVRSGPRAGRQIDALIVAELKERTHTVATLAKAIGVAERTVWRHIDKLEHLSHEVERRTVHALKPRQFRHVDGAPFPPIEDENESEAAE